MKKQITVEISKSTDNIAFHRLLFFKPFYQIYSNQYFHPLDSLTILSLFVILWSDEEISVL